MSTVFNIVDPGPIAGVETACRWLMSTAHRYVRADRIARAGKGRVELTVRAEDLAHDD